MSPSTLTEGIGCIIVKHPHINIVTINHHFLPILVLEEESIWVFPYRYGKKVMVKCNHNDNHQLPHPCQRTQEQ